GSARLRRPLTLASSLQSPSLSITKKKNSPPIARITQLENGYGVWWCQTQRVESGIHLIVGRPPRRTPVRKSIRDIRVICGFPNFPRNARPNLTEYLSERPEMTSQ